MLKKMLSLSIATVAVASTISCGSATTSLYKGTNTLGDSISNNINKIMNDAEDSLDNVNDMSDTYNQKIYTNKITNGYSNRYSTKDTYNYNGVQRQRSNSVIQNSLDNDDNVPIKKSNNMEVIPLDNDDKTVPKSNNIKNIPIDTLEDTAEYNANMNSPVPMTAKGANSATQQSTYPAGTPTTVSGSDVTPMVIA